MNIKIKKKKKEKHIKKIVIYAKLDKRNNIYFISFKYSQEDI